MSKDIFTGGVRAQFRQKASKKSLENKYQTTMQSMEKMLKQQQQASTKLMQEMQRMKKRVLDVEKLQPLSEQETKGLGMLSKMVKTRKSLSNTFAAVSPVNIDAGTTPAETASKVEEYTTGYEQIAKGVYVGVAKMSKTLSAKQKITKRKAWTLRKDIGETNLSENMPNVPGIVEGLNVPLYLAYQKKQRKAGVRSPSLQDPSSQRGKAHNERVREADLKDQKNFLENIQKPSERKEAKNLVPPTQAEKDLASENRLIERAAFMQKQEVRDKEKKLRDDPSYNKWLKDRGADALTEDDNVASKPSGDTGIPVSVKAEYDRIVQKVSAQRSAKKKGDKTVQAKTGSQEKAIGRMTSVMASQVGRQQKAEDTKMGKTSASWSRTKRGAFTHKSKAGKTVYKKD